MAVDPNVAVLAAATDPPTICSLALQLTGNPVQVVVNVADPPVSPIATCGKLSASAVDADSAVVALAKVVAAALAAQATP